MGQASIVGVLLLLWCVRTGPSVDVLGIIVDPEDVILQSALNEVRKPWYPLVPKSSPISVRWCVVDCEVLQSAWDRRTHSSVAATTYIKEDGHVFIEVNATADWGAATLKRVLAHEYGHVMGLPHNDLKIGMMNSFITKENAIIVAPTLDEVRRIEEQIEAARSVK